MGITADRFIEILAVRHRVLLLGWLAVIAHGLDRMTRDVDREKIAPAKNDCGDY